MFMKEYGTRLYSSGMVLHADGRRRYASPHGVQVESLRGLTRGDRAAVTGLSKTSVRRLGFIAANAAGRFRSLVTLTYHALGASWENAADVNHRIARRSKADMNRFLSCLRRELGAYLWVQEFQTRGVIHFHVLCEGEPSLERASLAWMRASGQLDDSAARAHGVDVQPVRTEKAARSYLGRYLGKARQKDLPSGVAGAGRWWGRSRSLQLEVVREAVTHSVDSAAPDRIASRVSRSVRRWLGRRLGMRVRGGVFVDWSGRFAPAAAAVFDALQEFYRRPERRPFLCAA